MKPWIKPWIKRSCHQHHSAGGRGIRGPVVAGVEQRVPLNPCGRRLKRLASDDGDSHD
jgi:hypothetical protein